MSTLIRNVDVVTLDAQGSVLRGTNIVIDGGRIAAIGAVPPDTRADTLIDGTNHLALPGFWNAHCHAAMTLVRGWAEDLPLDRWFNERIWVAESALTADGVYWGAALAVCEMIRSGCVGFNDMYFYMDRVGEVVEQAGVKACLTYNLFGIDADAAVGASLAGALAFVDTWQGRAAGRIRPLLGPHSPYLCPPGFLREVAAAAQEHAIPLHIHLAESAEQVANSRARYGVTPAAHLEACGVFDVPCVAAHALYLDDDDVALLARRGVSVAHCPLTYMKLAMGVNDLGVLMRAGINVALGSDGPGSNNDMDMKAAVRAAALLQKYELRDATALAGDAPLRMACQNGARALGFGESGSIEVGRAADIVLFDMDQPHLYPRHDLVANLVHTARGSDVSHVFVDGRLLYRKGELLTLDEERIKAEAERHARRMVGGELRQIIDYQS
jgi:5-methylthioadenosine/S-adenosylhomocysteine deaminase